MATPHVAAAELIGRVLAATAIDGDPSPYEEAMASPQREQWKVATREECNPILRNDAFAAMAAGNSKKGSIRSKIYAA